MTLNTQRALELLGFQKCIFYFLCTTVPYLQTQGSSRLSLSPQTGITTVMIIRHRGYSGRAGSTEIASWWFQSKAKTSDPPLNVNGQGCLLQVSDRHCISLLPFSSKVVTVQQPCTDPSEITAVTLVYTGWLISVLDHMLLKQDKGGLWSSAIFLSSAGLPEKQDQIQTMTFPISAPTRQRSYGAGEVYRGSIAFQTNKKSYRENMPRNLVFFPNLKAGYQILPPRVKDRHFQQLVSQILLSFTCLSHMQDGQAYDIYLPSSWSVIQGPD